jgi:diguanylate cyclase (GGDEF)-like protein
MPSYTPFLMLCAALLAVAATALSAYPWRRHGHRGYRCWLAALWLNAGGVGLIAWQGGAADVWVQLLLAPWPLLCVLGLRRFHARLPISGHPLLDIAAIGLLLLAGGLGASLLAADPLAPMLPALTASAAALLAALAAWSTPQRRADEGLLALGALCLAVALWPLASQRWAIGWPPAVQLAAAVTLASTALSFLLLAMGSRRTERSLRQSRRRLRLLANLDMLTQVPNRRRFEELARRALQTDTPGSATLLLVDIDHFKQINDQLGHAAGDRALKLVSRCTQELLRAHDVAGRHGGDEFVMLLRRSSTREAMQVADRLVSQLQAQAPAQALPPLTLSFGIVQMLPAESIDETLHRADLALYEAKRLGRSRAVAADGDPDRPVFRSSQRLGLSAS